jgi:protein-tyrosine-phosphatase
MEEAGIGISAATPKVLTAEAVQTSDHVITMGLRHHHGLR